MRDPIDAEDSISIRHDEDQRKVSETQIKEIENERESEIFIGLTMQAFELTFVYHKQQVSKIEKELYKNTKRWLREKTANAEDLVKATKKLLTAERQRFKEIEATRKKHKHRYFCQICNVEVGGEIDVHNRGKNHCKKAIKSSSTSNLPICIGNTSDLDSKMHSLITVLDTKDEEQYHSIASQPTELVRQESTGLDLGVHRYGVPSDDADRVAIKVSTAHSIKSSDTKVVNAKKRSWYDCESSESEKDGT